MKGSDFFVLAHLGDSSTVGIASNGIQIRSREDWTVTDLERQLDSFVDDIGDAFKRAIPLLLEQGIAYLQKHTLVVPTEQVYNLYQPEYGLCPWLPNWCPYWLHIEARGTIGYSDLQLSPKFYLGTDRISVRRVGPFIFRSSTPYILEKHVCQVLLNIDFFNALPGRVRSDKANTFKFVSALKKLAKSGVSFDKYISEQRILIANSVGLDLELDTSNRITLLPVIEGVPNSQMRRVHLAMSAPQEVYDFTLESGERLHVVTSPEVRKAIAAMNGYRRAGAKKRDLFIQDPMSVFARAGSIDVVELSLFDQRLEELGLSAKSKPIERISPSSATPPTPDADAQDAMVQPEHAGTESTSHPPERFLKVPIDRRDDSENLSLPMHEGSLVAEAVDQELEQAISESRLRYLREKERLIEISEGESAGNPHRKQAAEASPLNKLRFEAPSALLNEIDGKPFALKPHQRQGIAWLQNCLREANSAKTESGRHGALLADDMGLGKTIQVLTLLAWIIEAGTHDDGANQLKRPILIVAPLILLQVWERELRKFFYADGGVFQPYVVLHGETLRKLRGADKSLDVQRLRQNKLVISNYETVKHHIHSLKEIGWSVVVLDEAQEIKDPATNVARCIKLLECQLAIAMTGTPVENSLLDLWSIMEFVQPGLLGGSQEFLRKYAPDPNNSRAELSSHQLRGILNFDTPHAYIVRRTKEGSLDGLPPKKQVLRLVPITAEQAQLHRDLVQEIRNQTYATNHMHAFQMLQKIYQHPALTYETPIGRETGHYLDTCTKLQDLCNLLSEIKRRREKVLIFTRYINMQLILQHVLSAEFGRFEIINGADGGGSRTELRQHIIDRFEQKPGFNGLILSPHVAGVGLTITGANNVVHYGRWWNPAAEAQANGRVHRLGQTRPVNVYQMILTSPEFRTFDEQLHAKLSEKERVAADFLIPSAQLPLADHEIMDLITSDIDKVTSSSGINFSAAEVGKLSTGQLECLYAAIARKSGKKVHILPRTCGSARVIAIENKTVQIVCCNAVRDVRTDDLTRLLQESGDFLERRLSIGKLSGAEFKTALILNYAISSQSKLSLRKTTSIVDDAELGKLVAQFRPTIHDVYREEELRLNSLDELLRHITDN